MVDSSVVILFLPIVALVVRIIEFFGINLTELFSTPNFVIFLLLSYKYFDSPTSEGVNQLILPFQNSKFFV